MKILKLFGLAVSAMALMTGAAQASEATNVKGFYVGGAAGATFPMDSEVENKAVTQPDHKLSFDPGWGVTGAVGYKYGNGLRTELELGYRSASKESITNPLGNPALGVDGDLGVGTAMANLIYDMDVNFVLTPYVGVGVGYAHVWDEDLRIADSASTLLEASDESAGAFAYQAIGGFSYDFAPHWAATLDYRYLATTELDFGNEKVEYSSHNVMLGLRYEFNAPMAMAAAPAAAPAPMVAAPAAAPVATPNTYMVFFDFDKASITPEAKTILAAVAQEYKKGKTVRVHVTGHADRSGKPGYNDKLSNRRAAAVKAELDRLGVPAAEVVTKASGEKNPMIPTADGVREAQNRRAEIILGK
jgi:OmpA-OmpF porin, OOP family